MLLLILKSSACLAVFMVFYKLFLEKESIHHFKRFYLLGALLVSIGIPFITFTEYIEVVPMQDFIPFQALEFSNADLLIPEVTTTWLDYIPTIIWSIYFIGVLLFSFRFVLNLRAIFYRIRTNPKHQYHEFTNVLLQDLIHPHTFFKYIFLNKTKYEHNLIPNEVMLHEQTHAKQKHALDILCIEVLQIIFWFNPLLFFIKKDIKLNHEFLADQAVLQKGVDTAQYKQILLAFSSHASEPQLANAINYSLIKKRFTVMKSKTSKQAFWLRSLLLLPILTILIYSFSGKEIIEKEIALLEASATQQVETKKGATESMMKEYNAHIKNTEESNMIWQPKFNRAKAIYDIMTEAQRTTVKKYPKTPAINLASVKPKTPTKTEFDSWKNGDKFAVWIDGKNVSNETLNNYTSSDFTYYTVSKVYKNAQTKKHPQPFQNHLYTKKGFEEGYLKYNVKKYNAFKNDYQNAQKTLKQGDSELRILKVRLDRAYKVLTNEEIEKYDVNEIKPFSSNSLDNIKSRTESKGKGPQIDELSTNTKQQEAIPSIILLINYKGQLLVNDDVCKIENLKNLLKKLSTEDKKSEVEIETDINAPTETITKVKSILRELGILKINYTQHTQQQATPKQIEEYNSLAKKFNKNPNGVIKSKDVNRLKYLYSLMSKEQKEKKAEPFPKFAPPPPPPPISPNATPAQKKKYQEVIDNYNKTYSKNGEVVLPTPAKTTATRAQIAEYKNIAKEILSKGNVIVMQKHIQRLEKIYNLMSLEQKKLVTSFSKIVPPPPPPPPVIMLSNDQMKHKSKELQEAWGKFSKKTIKYSKAIKGYQTGESSFDDLSSLYKDVMLLYNDYKKVADKGNIVPPPPPPAMDTIYTYNSLAKRTKLIPNNRKNNIQYLKILFNKMSNSKKEKVETPSSINKFIEKLDNLTTEQIGKINKTLKKIRAESKGRKFYSAAAYKKLEDLYASMMSDGKKK